MRARNGLVALTLLAVAGGLALGSVATPATADATVKVEITEAPAHVGIAGDFKYVDMLATDTSGTASGQLRWDATFTANEALVSGDLYVEGLEGSSWVPLTPHLSNGHLSVVFDSSAAFSMAPGASHSGELRYLLVDGAGDGPGAFLSSLTTDVGVEDASSQQLADDSAQAGVGLLTIDAPGTLSATAGQATVVDVTTVNGTGSNFATLATIPSTVYDGSAKGSKLGSGSDATVQWLHNGSYVTVNSLSDLPVVTLAEGGVSTVQWRITPATAGSRTVTWNAVRVGYDLDATEAAASGSPDTDALYFAGQGSSSVTIAAGSASGSSASPSATATSTSSASATATTGVSVTTGGTATAAAGSGDDADANPSDSASATASSSGAALPNDLAATGAALVRQFWYAILLLLVGGLLFATTRRRTPGAHE